MPPKCNRASWTYYESLHYELEASTDEISWPTMGSTIWLQLLGTNFSSPKMNPCLFLSLSFGNFTYEPLWTTLQMSHGQLASGKCWSFLAPLTQRWFLSIWLLAWQMFFFVFRGTRAGRQQKHGGKGGRPFEEGKGWKQDSWISWGWKMAPSNSYTIDTFQHLERGSLHGSFTGCQFTTPLGLIGAPLKVLVEECI